MPEMPLHPRREVGTRPLDMQVDDRHVVELVGARHEGIEQDRWRRGRAVQIDLVAGVDGGRRLGRGDDTHDGSLRGGWNPREVPSDRVATCHSGLPTKRRVVWTEAMTDPVTPGTLRIRPIDGADGDGLTAFYAALSPESLEARFHGAARGLGGRAAGYMCGPDHDHREGIVAEVLGEDGGSTII